MASWTICTPASCKGNCLRLSHTEQEDGGAMCSFCNKHMPYFYIPLRSVGESPDSLSELMTNRVGFKDCGGTTKSDRQHRQPALRDVVPSQQSAMIRCVMLHAVEVHHAMTSDQRLPFLHPMSDVEQL